DEKSVMLSEHPFPQDQNGTMKEVSLYVKGRQNQVLDPVSAVLRVNGREKGRYRIPVKILGSQEYEDTFEKMYHGK
ncbi:MAG: hypothetical protein PUF13_08640, partial [Lachnospiraceae bacterium]|nr:hypothetical protein [Lachnospiraceae bacterium]